jgi:hypothetical protein
MTTGGVYSIVPSPDVDDDGWSVCEGDCDDTDPATHPGAEEACNGEDDDCNFSIDDGVPVPLTRPAILVGKTGTAADLSWPVSPDATGYDAVKGNLGPLRASQGNFAVTTKACIGNDLGATFLQDGEVPPASGGLWYLVRPVNACSGAGTYDSEGTSQNGSRDAEIAASSNACP